MKKIAISQRIEEIKYRNETWDTLDQKLTQFVYQAGGLPIPVPNKLISGGLLNEWINYINPDAIILSGGNNIGDYSERDLTEKYLLDFASDSLIPTLGICRGMQMMGVWGGSKLKRIEQHVKSRHDLLGEIKLNVNSFHNYSLNECPKDFVISAKSIDGEIEAISHSKLPWEGWMWHPEREIIFSKEQLQRFKALINRSN